ncbi:2-oxo acid dehydrogenase subunit E2 [Salinadaptatus halalkaliphilus]|uniref:2-oxo acid dehydrogenase subunit E2 n=1 Tax=Salinadaptatus halalkaliphilus TaxID=2419781 RepID=A0A4S3TP86_9EURY|nr:dihydrolipoamide acetyltransferase family protein [Salinadaptatus halalkaliphilus]THE66122.1 2-oxo acid dehydrogenase subunit E2 [Salinadaptatus halalkaliphilus]
MQELTLPKLGQAMEEGLVLEWHCDVGDELTAGDPVVVIESEKTSHEIEADQDGRLLAKRVDAGDTVPIGTTLGYVGTDDEADDLPDDSAAETDAGAAEPSDADASPADRQTASDSSGDVDREQIGTETRDDGPAPETIRASPSARKAARVHDVDVTAVGQAVGVAQVRPEHVDEYVAAQETDSGEEIRGSPAARRIADERGVDLEAVGEDRGTTRVRMADVEQYADQQPASIPATDERIDDEATAAADPSPSVRETVSITGGRQVMFDRMQTVSSEYGSTTTVAKVDVTELRSLLDSLGSSWEAYHDVSPSLTAFVLRAVAQELPAYPMLNAEIVDDDGTDAFVRQFEDINLGLAVDTDHGLLVPTIYDADTQSVTELGDTVSDLARQARERDLEMEQQQNGTFTVSNAGTFGAYINTPQINPPQTGILGVCTVNEEPGVVDGEVVPREMMHLCLTYDHRVVEGATAVQFLQAVKRRLEDPQSLLS